MTYGQVGQHGRSPVACGCGTAIDGIALGNDNELQIFALGYEDLTYKEVMATAAIKICL